MGLTKNKVFKFVVILLSSGLLAIVCGFLALIESEWTLYKFILWCLLLIFGFLFVVSCAILDVELSRRRRQRGEED
jgi:hypothetical protein